MMVNAAQRLGGPVALLLVAIIANLLLLRSFMTSAVSAQQRPIFTFHTDEVWLNLHQFLYVLGRHESGNPDRLRRAQIGAPADADKGLIALSPDEQRQWRDAVTFYAQGFSKLDAIFDEPLIKTGEALARAGDESTLAGSGLDPALAATLAKAAPLYQKAWWPAHEKANRTWQRSTEALVAQHGGRILAFVTRAYGLPWPANGFPIHVSAYANWAGAFSTGDNLLIISSLDSGNAGLVGLETSFHEAMHQWDREVHEALATHARRQMKKIPEGLTHAMIWLTAAEAMRSIAPDYVGYAEANGLWRQRTLAQFKPVLDEVWKPYLGGKGTHEDAFAAIVARLPPL
jgi:hypothetical protein